MGSNQNAVELRVLNSGELKTERGPLLRGMTVRAGSVESEWLQRFGVCERADGGPRTPREVREHFPTCRERPTVVNPPGGKDRGRAQLARDLRGHSRRVADAIRIAGAPEPEIAKFERHASQTAATGSENEIRRLIDRLASLPIGKPDV